MWIYEQRTGRLRLGDRVVATGYSGHGEHKNDPNSQHLRGLGPLPRAAYLLGDYQVKGPHGPLAIHLVPIGGELFGRSAFMVHGDSKEHPGEASEGCIILARPIREMLIASRDRLLVVLSGDPVQLAA